MQYGHKMPKLTKSIAEQYIAMNLRVHPQQINFIRLHESPKEWKHACVSTGAVMLSPRKLVYTQYPTTISEIHYTVCSACRTVHYYFESPYVNY